MLTEKKFNQKELVYVMMDNTTGAYLLKLLAAYLST